jgi:hypothetical protein
VALRGDLPSGTALPGEFRYAAELVGFIRETQGRDWHIEVAAYPEYHPQQRYAKRDLEHFAAKVKAGADSAITQFFFNPDAYFHFVDEVRALGVDVPIVPGIMPIHNYARIAQFAARDGIEIPRWVALKMEGYLDDAASIRAFGLDVVTQLCERLIAGGAPAIHFYTLNQSALSLEICRRLATSPTSGMSTRGDARPSAGCSSARAASPASSRRSTATAAASASGCRRTRMSCAMHRARCSATKARSRRSRRTCGRGCRSNAAKRSCG